MNPFLASSSVVPGRRPGRSRWRCCCRPWSRALPRRRIADAAHRPPRRHRRRRHPAGRRPRARPGGRHSLRRARRGVCGNDVAARRPDRHRPARRRGAPLHLGDRGGVATEQRRPDRLAERLRRRGVRQGQGVLFGRHDLRQGRRARHRVPGPHARRRRDVGGRSSRASSTSVRRPALGRRCRSAPERWRSRTRARRSRCRPMSTTSPARATGSSAWNGWFRRRAESRAPRSSRSASLLPIAAAILLSRNKGSDRGDPPATSSTPAGTGTRDTRPPPPPSAPRRRPASRASHRRAACAGAELNSSPSTRRAAARLAQVGRP